MELLYISTFMFHNKDGVIYGLPSCSDTFFGKYLDVFSSVRVLGEEVKSYLDKSALVKIEDPRITVKLLPKNTHPKDFKNDGVLKKALKEEIAKAEAILIKPATRRGMMAIKICEKMNKPYMIEMTGDIHNALKQNPSCLKRAYAPLLYKQITNAIKNCKFGLYVSESYLQGEFPINGKMCGCTDVVLDKSEPIILEKRLNRIDNMQSGDIVKMALVGFYQGNGKGVDTALRAMAKLPDNYQLFVLGNGTEESRQKWYNYAKEQGVKAERLHFPKPLPSAKEVLLWLDTMDVFVFPTRSEGFGRCVAEAMSRGVPCFATDICTMPELLPQECLFPLDDHEKLASLLWEYVEDKDALKQLAKINFKNVEKYDADLLRQRRNEFLTEFKNYCENNKEN